MKAIRVSDQVIELCDVPEPKGEGVLVNVEAVGICGCLLYTSPSPRDLSTSRMPSSA